MSAAAGGKRGETMIRIIESGLCTTVQDRGRSGCMKLGITGAGAMDERSYEIANILVGNDGGEAALEATLIGPEIEFVSECWFAVTGGNLGPHLNGEPIAMYRPLLGHPGDRLTFAGRKTGCRAYIAFRGGLDVPVVLGSRATDMKAKLGGRQGRALRTGDEIALRLGTEKMCASPISPEDFSGRRKVLRVLMGPQEDYFTAQGIHMFLSTPYTVTPKCDRMGCRFSGEPIPTVSGSDIITDGICMGAVQIPADGLPIIMLADRQPTGGYAKIANVISVDLPVAAQLIPGDVVEFSKVTIREAQELLLHQKEQLDAMRKSVAASAPRRYRVVVGGEIYTIELETMEGDIL